jgi:drug/metabolite transporter (DMT)-like permease
MNRRRVVGVALGALAGAGYGFGPFLFKASVHPDGVDWIAMLYWRFGLAALVSWAWLLAQPRARAALRSLDRRAVARLLLTGVVFVVDASLYFAAVERIDISLVALIASTYPALVAVLSLRLGYKFSGRLAWGSLVLVLCGTVLTIGAIGPSANQGGILLALLAPVAYTAYIMLAAWMAGERPGKTADMRSGGRGAEVSPPVAGAIMTTGSWIATLVLGLAAGEPLLPTQVPSAAWPGLIGIGVLSAAVAIQAFYAAAARIGAARASLMTTVQPVVVIVLGVAFLGEAFTPVRALGAAIVLAGVVLAQFATLPDARPAPAGSQPAVAAEP